MRDDSIIPAWLKYIMVFIDRVGFPIVAFGVMTYMCFVTLEKLTVSLNNLTQAVLTLRK